MQDPEIQKIYVVPSDYAAHVTICFTFRNGIRRSICIDRGATLADLIDEMLKLETHISEYEEPK